MQHLQKTRGVGSPRAISSFKPTSHLAYVLPSSVSGNPIVYHSYENTGVWMYSSHFGTRRFSVSLCPYLPSSLPRYLVTSQPSPSRQTTAARFPACWLLCG